MILRNTRWPFGAHSDLPVARMRVHGPDVSIDLEGRYVIPGLWDHHVHFGQWAMASRRLDLADATSAAHVAALVRQALTSATPPTDGAVFVAAGFRDALWPDAPSPGLLDVRDTPIAALSADVHSVWLNTAAVRLLGLAETDWFLREQAAFDVMTRISTVSAAVSDLWAAEAAATAAARGVVGIVDFDMADAPGTWARRFVRGFPGLRVRAATYPNTPDPPPVDSPRFEVGPYKLFADGSLNTRTAWCGEPYPETHDHGLPTYRHTELLAAAREGLARGLRPAIHAIGDAAVTEALDVFEQLGVTGSIEHVQLIRKADLPRLHRLGVAASVQPEHAMDDRDVADRYWAGRTDRAYAYRSLLDARAQLALGSDAPVAPLDPWITLAAAVTRSRDGRDPWHPEQRLTPAEALAASTHPENTGDLVVLDADPRDPDALRGMPVHATLVDGIWTHGPYQE